MNKILILLLVLSFLPFCGKTQEPTYEGKALSAWIKDLKDTSTRTQEKAQKALIEIGEPSIPYMIKILKREKDNAVKVQAAYILAGIGKSTKDAVSILIETIKNEKQESELAYASAHALLNIKPNTQEIVPEMINLVKTGTQSQRVIAAKVLGEMGDETKEDIIKLINEIKEQDKELAKQLVKTIYSSIIEKMENLEEEANSCWSILENIFQRRLDIIPNYLTVVKRYASQEIEMIERLKNTCSKVEVAKTISEKAKANEELTAALNKLSIAIEKYPSIKQDRDYGRLIDELAALNNRIGVQKERYNYAVEQFNEKLNTLPIPELFEFKPATSLKY